SPQRKSPSKFSPKDSSRKIVGATGFELSPYSSLGKFSKNLIASSTLGCLRCQRLGRTGLDRDTVSQRVAKYGEVEMITGGNVTVYVSDIDRAVAFYVNQLGLKLSQRFGNHWAEVRVGDTLVIGLHPKSDKGPAPGTSGAMSIGLS